MKEIKAISNQKKRSWTWKYFEDVDIIKEKTSNKGKPLKRCKVIDLNGNKCGTLYINDGSTGNAINKVAYLQLLYIVQSPAFCRYISELDPDFIMPDEKGIKKVIYGAYNFILPTLIEKLKVNAKSVSIIGQGYIESLKEILKEWNLYDKVFTITTDNTANIKRAIANIKNISWQRFSAYTIQLIVEKVLVPAKVLIVQVKQLIEFFMRPK
ncbi:hypothetical protein RhiirA5_436552 [Rhizophagus irregularis]|uniref:Uncharacterized protein n=1 Tax=Rhizophagus irregularis TaxID=588596 RepID=A0A2N0NLU6_9GLOM|nr:hypothetical protein RhiirA5_436552 [Rhizophagus irregularis]